MYDDDLAKDNTPLGNQQLRSDLAVSKWRGPEDERESDRQVPLWLRETRRVCPPAPSLTPGCQLMTLRCV